ncbi:MAG: hypothetical protein ACXWT0_03965 [Methylobacter sp.]
MDIVTGDDTEIEITLKIGDSVFEISDAAIVKAAIVNKFHTSILAGPITVSRLEVGSDWSKSLIVLKIPGRSTAVKITTPAKLEVQVNDAGKKITWFADVTLIQGLIQ